MRTILSVLLSVAIAVVPAMAQTNTAIVAGRSVGALRIGGNVSDALRELGSLVDRSDSRDGKYTVYDWPLRPHLIIAEKASGNIVLIMVSLSDAYRTDKGITAGSERSAVESGYGREFTTEEDAVSVTLIYDAQGVSFEIGKAGVLSGRVLAIMVYAPGTWKQLIDAI